MGELERERFVVGGEVVVWSSREGMVLCCWRKVEIDAWNFEEVAGCGRSILPRGSARDLWGRCRVSRDLETQGCNDWI